MFRESGLPEGVAWSVLYNGRGSVSISPNSTSSSTPPGNYTFIVSYPTSNGITYIPNPSNGTLTAGGLLTINFTQNVTLPQQKTTFQELGLPNNSSWSVTFNGINISAIAPNSIVFSTSPGNYTYTIGNVSFGGLTYLPKTQSGVLEAGGSPIVNFSASYSESIPSASTSLPASNLGLITTLRTSLPNGALFISNESPIAQGENGTSVNVIAPVYLSFQNMSNITAINSSQLESVRSQVNKFYSGGLRSAGISALSVKNSYSGMYVFNENISAQYGSISQSNNYVPAGRTLHYIAYNTYGIITYYNVSVHRTRPTLKISVNGAIAKNPNTTSVIHIPILNGQSDYNISVALDSVLAGRNQANFTYKINFSNGTIINRTLNANYVNYSETFTLPADQNATITFETGGNANYTPVDPTVVIVPAAISYYLPITLTNSQTVATPAPFQEEVSVNSLDYSSYEANNLDNIEFFYAAGNIISSWMEGSVSNTLLNNPKNSSLLHTSTNTTYWLNISKGIPASNSITVYMGFAPVSVSLLNNINVGESPQISSIYGQYDDGTNVFDYYNVNPTSTSGWTLAGIAGRTGSAPSGNHFITTNALYANSANGDYLYTSILDLTTNVVITYDVYTTGLGDFFFLTNSAGKGQMTRLDGRGGADYSGLATTSTWKSWAAPSSGLSETTKVWYKYDTVVSGTSAYSYIGNMSDSLSTYGKQTSSTAFTVVDDGNYLGLVGDGLGSSYITYWDGIIIRAEPPGGVMPVAALGTVVASDAPVLIFQSNPISYGVSNLITLTTQRTGDSVEILKNGNVIAGPAANSVSYSVCGASPSLSSCWSPGSYVITGKDVNSGVISNGILIVNKGTPSLKLVSANIVLNTLSSTPVNYSISTIGNQLSANLIINNNYISSTSSSNTYSLATSIGNYKLKETTAGNSNYTSYNLTKSLCIVQKPSSFPTGLIYYAPVCIINNQSSSSSAQFQQMINISEDVYSGYLSYNGEFANFEIFNATGSVQPSWIESNDSGVLTTWIKMPGIIGANAVFSLYLGFAPNTLNLLSNSGTSGIGEIPTASGSYGEYDDGASVFENYFPGNSLSTWTNAGTSGQTSSAPSGSPFGTNAFYANGANGDYLYTTANGQAANMIIEYYTDTANLDDVFFLTNSSGGGQIGRVGNGVGWYGIASSSSWTSWTAPPDNGQWSNKWLLISIVSINGTATMYLSPNAGNYGSEIGQNASNSYSVANNGDYLGFVGDAAGGTTTQYLNGMIIRQRPPNGIMPSSVFGSPTSIQSTCSVSISPATINFGSLNPGSSFDTNQVVTDYNNGTVSANMLVYAGNWINGAVNFGLSKTLWNPTSLSSYTGNAMTTAPTLANIIIPASGSNSIYFGLSVPPGQSAGSYSQTITIENEC
jgi:hypothetical protein